MNKNSLREHYLLKEKQLDHNDFRLRNEQIKNLFVAYFSDFKVEVVHTFLPITTKNEINTLPILEAFRNRNPKLKTIVSKSDFKTLEMKSYLLQSDTVLAVIAGGFPSLWRVFHLMR